MGGWVESGDTVCTTQGGAMCSTNAVLACHAALVPSAPTACGSCGWVCVGVRQQCSECCYVAGGGGRSCVQPAGPVTGLGTQARPCSPFINRVMFSTLSSTLRTSASSEPSRCSWTARACTTRRYVGAAYLHATYRSQTRSGPTAGSLQTTAFLLDIVSVHTGSSCVYVCCCPL